MSIIFRLFFITVSKGQTITFDITPIDTDKVSKNIYINIKNDVNSLNGIYRIIVQKIVVLLQNRRICSHKLFKKYSYRTGKQNIMHFLIS